jgi:hypothetical protein
MIMRSVMETLYSGLSRLSRVTLNHEHPVETASAPDMTSRRASATFTVIANTNNFVLGAVTYTFVTALGSPAANNVQILIQGALRDTVKILAQATQGVTDATNIAYGTGTQPHPTCVGYWTSQRFALGLTSVAAGESLFLLERAEDVITAITLTSTATATLNAFQRTPFSRYILNGNAAGAGGINSIRGAMHTILPVGSIILGGQTAPMGLAAYDVHGIFMEDQSSTDKKEIDIYISNDEVTFTRVSRSNPMAFNSTAASIQVHVPSRGQRIPKGYGMFIRCGSDGTSASATFDLKFSYHLYPANLS